MVKTGIGGVAPPFLCAGQNDLDGCDDICAVSDVAAHEIAHAVGFEPISPYNLIERFRELMGGPRDLMREQQGQPTAPLQFNMNRDKNIKPCKSSIESVIIRPSSDNYTTSACSFICWRL